MVIVIAGPTAVGKTKLSIELAKKLNGEIINADSTQVFRGLDIATAKIKEEEKEGITHHLFDIKDFDEDYTVYEYQIDCRRIIDKLLAEGKTPILVGGTGLYISAALYDYSFDEEAPNDNEYPDKTNDELYLKLLEVDYDTLIHPNNRRRIVRALNYYEANKKPISSKEKANKILYDTVFIGLTADREILYDKINQRTDLMIKEGLIDEAKKIYDSGVRTRAILTPIGYKELFEYFDNKITLDEAIELIKQRCRNYAKRQYTWFNNKMDITWFEVDYDNFDDTINKILKFIKKT